MTGSRKRQIMQMMNDPEEEAWREIELQNAKRQELTAAPDPFDQWWSTISVGEQKLLGYNNARFVWQEALRLNPA